jgi:CheY-like chemotaxis protein
MLSANQAVLLVEDDENDVFLLQHALATAGITHAIPVVADGQQAIAYLAGADHYVDRRRFPFPGLVLLDLKLPVCTGLDVLRWLQEQPSLCLIPVIVLSSSANGRDVDEAYRLGARAFLVKPVSVGARLELAKAIKAFWLDLNEFPILEGRTGTPAAARE